MCDVLSHLPLPSPVLPPPLEPDWIRSEAAPSESNQTLAFFFFFSSRALPPPHLPPRTASGLQPSSSSSPQIKPRCFPATLQTFAESRRKRTRAAVAFCGQVTSQSRIDRVQIGRKKKKSKVWLMRDFCAIVSDARRACVCARACCARARPELQVNRRQSRTLTEVFPRRGRGSVRRCSRAETMTTV